MTEPRRIRLSFREDMYVASVERRKTETRRVIVPQPPPDAEVVRPKNIADALVALGYAGPEGAAWFWYRGDTPAQYWPDTLGGARPMHCPYGVPGDLLGLTEPFKVLNFRSIRGGMYADVGYKWRGRVLRINVPVPRSHWDAKATQPRDKWLNGRFMPLWAVRRWAVNTGVRVERVQDITDTGAKAEGVGAGVMDADGFDTTTEGYHTHWLGFRPRFHYEWNRLNGARGYGWEANPSVWVVSYTMEENHE